MGRKMDFGKHCYGNKCFETGEGRDKIPNKFFTRRQRVFIFSSCNFEFVLWNFCANDSCRICNFYMQHKTRAYNPKKEFDFHCVRFDAVRMVRHRQKSFFHSFFVYVQNFGNYSLCNFDALRFNEEESSLIFGD